MTWQTKVDKILWHPFVAAAALAWYGYRFFFKDGEVTFWTVSEIVACVAWLLYAIWKLRSEKNQPIIGQ